MTCLIFFFTKLQKKLQLDQKSFVIHKKMSKLKIQDN